MSATKSAKKFAKTQATKAKAKAGPTPKNAAPAECPRGDGHVWKDDGDGQPYCEKCFEPKAKKGGKRSQPDKPTPAAEAPTPPKAKAKPAGETKAAKKLSAIDAAARVLTDAKTAMNAQEMIEAMATQNLWTSPGGKTPHATLYSAILREIGNKGSDARFVKTERGKFTARA